MQQNSDIALVTKTAPIATVTHGGRAKCLQRLVRLDLPVPKTVSLSFEMVHRIASNEGMDVANILSEFSQDDLLCVRPSSESPDWGGPRAVLNVGINDAQYERLCNTLGKTLQIYLRFVQGYPFMWHGLILTCLIISKDRMRLHCEALDAYEQETEEQFPQDRSVQLAGFALYGTCLGGNNSLSAPSPRGPLRMRVLGLSFRKWPLVWGKGNMVQAFCNWWIVKQATHK